MKRAKARTEVLAAVEAAGVQVPDKLAQIRELLASSFPDAVYSEAVRFLGAATLILVLGALVLLGLGMGIPDALWGAIGAAIGALAGIFAGAGQTCAAPIAIRSSRISTRAC